MEARRAFQGDVKSSKIWFAVVAILAAMALGLAGGYLGRNLTAASAPTSGHVVQAGFQAPDAQERNSQILSNRNPQTQYVQTHKHQTVS
jgi:hypothetical protein